MKKNARGFIARAFALGAMRFNPWGYLATTLNFPTWM